jgi:hypothetical protein
MIRDFFFTPDPDPGVKKAPDPGPATLLRNLFKNKFFPYSIFNFLETVFFHLKYRTFVFSQSPPPFSLPLIRSLKAPMPTLLASRRFSGRQDMSVGGVSRRLGGRRRRPRHSRFMGGQGPCGMSLRRPRTVNGGRGLSFS